MTLKEFLKGIADAIRAKEGSTADIPAQDMAARIGAIETGVQLPTLTNPGAAGDLRSGKQLIGQDGSTVNGSLSEVTQATPGISVSSSGLITASVTQSGGIVSSGTKSATKQLSSNDDYNFVPEKIKKGYSIFGVTGTLEYIEPATVTVTNNYNNNNGIYVGWENSDGTTGSAYIGYGQSETFETKKVFVISSSIFGLCDGTGCQLIQVSNNTIGGLALAVTPTYSTVSVNFHN